MSTCSTATSTLRGHESRRRRRRRVSPETCDAAAAVEAVHGRLERRLVDLERDWDAYKTGHSGAAPRHRHRRSRSATAATPSSAVTTVAAPSDALLLPLYRCSSPRTLVSSLQQIGSTDADSGRAAKIVSGGADSAVRSYEGEGGLSSVCSVEAGHSAAALSSSCSCSCRCAACCCSYSTRTSSTCAGAAAPPSSSAAGGDVVGERARKRDEGRPVAGTCSRTAWISAIALVVVGFIAMAILDLRVDCAEYLVPT